MKIEGNLRLGNVVLRVYLPVTSNLNVRTCRMFEHQYLHVSKLRTNYLYTNTNTNTSTCQLLHQCFAFTRSYSYSYSYS